MPLYHCTHLDLKDGDIIKPGNWGTIIFQNGPSHQCWGREIILEAVRVYSYPDKPSRLKSTYACETIETIKCFKGKNCSEGFIYEVDILEPNAPRHKGDFNAVQPMPNHSDDMWKIAHKYWQYTLKTDVQEWPGVECSEIVTLSPLKIIKKVE